MSETIAEVSRFLRENNGVFLDADIFAEMKKALEDTFSSGAIVIIATMAKPCEQRMCQKILERTRLREEALNEFSKLMNNKNWGKMSFFDLDFERISGKIIVKNSFEARQRGSKTSCCHFFANLIAGFMSELFAENVIVKEEKCAGKGDDHCEFRFNLGIRLPSINIVES